jgi:hypothetical protein
MILSPTLIPFLPPHLELHWVGPVSHAFLHLLSLKHTIVRIEEQIPAPLILKVHAQISEGLRNLHVGQKLHFPSLGLHISQRIDFIVVPGDYN